MSNKKQIPEVDVVVDTEAGVLREVPPEKTRSKKGHERRVNAAVYVTLVVMSVIWLTPFVFLVCQSFRSFLNESGGMEPYVIPQKGFSMDNYKALFIKNFTAKQYIIVDMTGQDFFDAVEANPALAEGEEETLSILRAKAEAKGNLAKVNMIDVVNLVKGDAALDASVGAHASDYVRSVFSSVSNARFSNDFKRDFTDGFIPWWLTALAVSACFAAVMTAACALIKRLSAGSDKVYRFRMLLLLLALAAAFAGFLTVIGQRLGYVPGDTGEYVKVGIVFALFAVFSIFAANGYLKMDGRLLQQIPGYPKETAWEKIRKVPVLFLEFLLMFLIMCCALQPMENSNYLSWYGNTLTIALFTAVIQTVIVLSVSYALSRLRFKGRKLIMNVVLVLGLFPGFLTMITLYFLLKQMGLTQAGSVPGLILIYCASSGMGYYISKGFFDTIPKSLDESARIDGATRFQVFLKIIMPLAKPIVIYTILMAFMGPWGDYVFASYVAFGSRPNYNVAVGLYEWINVADYQGYFTLFCAGGVLVALPITALFLALQKYYVEGVTGGAVKG